MFYHQVYSFSNFFVSEKQKHKKARKDRGTTELHSEPDARACPVTTPTICGGEGPAFTCQWDFTILYLRDSGDTLTFFQAIPRDTFSTPGRYPSELSFPGTTRVRMSMDCGHRGTCWCGENGIRNFMWRGSGILKIMRDPFVRRHGISRSSRDRGGFRLAPTEMRGASDAFTHLSRNVAQLCSLWGFVESCGCPQVKCKPSAEDLSPSLFVRDGYCHWAGRMRLCGNFCMFRGAGAGC